MDKIEEREWWAKSRESLPVREEIKDLDWGELSSMTQFILISMFKDEHNT